MAGASGVEPDGREPGRLVYRWVRACRTLALEADMLDSPFAFVPEPLRAWFDEKVAPWLGVFVAFVAIRWGADAATRFNRGLGLVLTTVLAFWLFGLLLGWRGKRYDRTYSRSMRGALWLFTLLAGIAVFSAISVLLVSVWPESFSGPPPIDRNAFTNFYFWHAVDAIPGLKLWDSFDVPPPPHHQRGLAAGTCVLVFRVGVLATLFSTLKNWMGRSDGALHDAASQTADGAIPSSERR
jgi:hypothetical protein